MKNKSFTYLLPLYCKFFIKENSELEENLFIYFIDNCYSYYKVNDKLENYFIIKLEIPEKDDKIFRIFLSNLKKSSIFVEQITNNGEITLKFKIPDEIINTYFNFINGEYSKINDIDKITILQFSKRHISLDFSNEVNQIFHKSDRIRKELEEKLGMKIPKDLELSSIPVISKETFKL